MARGLDSDYIGSLSLMDGFDMSINFDGFGENMKKFMELPIKYLDSAHDKAVGLVEDIHALIYAPYPDNELSNKGQRTLMDPSSSNPITGSNPTFAEMEQANPDEEVSSSPSSLLTAEDSSLCSTDTDAHETESVTSKSPDCCTSEDTISLERTAGTKEKIILCSSENLPDSCTPENCNSLVRTVSSEDEIILWNPGKSLKPPQPPEQATIVQDYASQEANTERVIKQVGVYGSTSGNTDTESSACDGAVLFTIITANGEEQSGLYSTNGHEESAKHDFVDIDLRGGQVLMKYDKAEASLVPQPKNRSFKKVLMKSLSNKLRWSKTDMNVHQVVPIRPHKGVNACYEVVSSSDDLEDDWELL
ncbi:uncharacterized protein [Lolium perenne]|uniref:uncharacterized protein isoform X2 n=1 Tax=Lolium perenne TaxID=4522 RepID=UPI0021F5600B|nr:uncharacterized protein LOC127341924 isoform X2 [Lolium perenne]